VLSCRLGKTASSLTGTSRNMEGERSSMVIGLSFTLHTRLVLTLVRRPVFPLIDLRFRPSTWAGAYRDLPAAQQFGKPRLHTVLRQYACSRPGRGGQGSRRPTTTGWPKAETYLNGFECIDPLPARVGGISLGEATLNHGLEATATKGVGSGNSIFGTLADYNAFRSDTGQDACFS
jgi:hypothetical protein